jgi:hypothetical protein
MSDPTQRLQTVTDPGRSNIWLPLIRRLSAATDTWYVWKNAESALYGRGDIDCAAPAEVWEDIEDIFREWAREQQLHRVIACRHIPRTLNLIGVSDDFPDLLQLEVKGLTTFRGSTLFRAEDLLPLTHMDPLGFRRLRNGPEGLFKFITNGVRRGGEPHHEWLVSKQVMELIESDLEGMRAAANVFGHASTWILAAVESARRGEWDRSSLRKVETAAWLKTLRQPHILAERIWFRVARKPFCPLLKTIYQHDRVPPANRNEWLARVEKAHARGGRIPTAHETTR